MQLNAQFPTRYVGNDPAMIKDWAQATEDMGYAMIEVPDHVFGAAPRDSWTPRYDASQPFHETFATLGFLAAATKTIGLSSGVLILPQRQTGVVAKQAAEVDLLSGGRLRLGIGVGWNHVEYEALDCDWTTRGARQAEQVEVLRLLWSEELVSFKGRFHDFQDINIVPGPKQRPIPIWFGGASSAVVKRAARIGDGWMPILPTGPKAEARIEMLRGHLKEFGRDPATFPIEVWLRADEMDPDAWAADAAFWRKLGVDQVMLYPMFPLPTLDAQLDALRRFRDAAKG